MRSVAIRFNYIQTLVRNVSIIIGHTESAPFDFVCPRGFFCREGSDSPRPCCVQNLSDLYCVGNRCFCNLYQGNAGQDSCSLCPAGMSCPVFNISLQPAYSLATESCPPYHYCTKGQIPRRCMNGTFTDQNHSVFILKSDCSPCPAGLWCSEGKISGLCAAGYICSEGSSCAMPVFLHSRKTRPIFVTSNSTEFLLSSPCSSSFFNKR